MRIYAHRGYRARYPENTLLAFSKAIDAGCDGIELDVQLTKDRKIVIIHDEDVSRTTDGSGAVCDMTYARLCELDAGLGEKIPLLSEYFDLAGKLPIYTNIELKNSIVPYEGMEELVLEMVRSYGLSNKVIISSFSHESVNKMKNIALDIKCGYICGSRFDADALAAAMRETNVEYVHPYVNSLDAELMEAVRRNGLKISVWTVNDEDKMRWLAEQGAYGVFTDDPPLLVAKEVCGPRKVVL